MSKPSSRRIPFHVYLLATLLYSNIAIAAEQIYLREYTYQASEADSKISARAIALQEVKRILLSELGTHVSSLVKQQSSSDGTQLGTEQIETLSAGVTRVEILEEKWNGVVYVLKAQIKADPEDVLKSLHKMLDADKKQKQLSQLGGDLSKIRSENIQIAESLTQSKKETTAALAEIVRLKQQLEEKQTDASRQSLQTAYKQQVEQLTLSELYESAIKNLQERDYLVAFRLFKKAAEQGSPAAQLFLGVMYFNGEGVSRDVKQSVYWIQKAAEQRFALAQLTLGHILFKNEGVSYDAKQALYWVQKAADQGYVNAQNNLGARYLKGDGVIRDVEQAVYWFRKAADQDDVEAQFTLGGIFNKGEGVIRDAKQSVYWYLKASEQGYAPAQFALGVMYAYARGEGVARDAKQAVYWYQKAADQGIPPAQYQLGWMYGAGEGVTRDTKKAVYWYQKAAVQGDAAAQLTLGLLYYKGEWLTLDLMQAVYWWQKAAEQGDAAAQFNLGLSYAVGEGVERDNRQSVYWFQKAAEQGHVQAQNILKDISRAK